MSSHESRWTKQMGLAQQGHHHAQIQLLDSCRSFLLKAAGHRISPAVRAKESASDLVQMTFIDAYKRFGEFKEVTRNAFHAWLWKLLKGNLNLVVRRYRATAKRRVDREEVAGVEAEAPHSGPVSRAVRRERTKAVREAIERLEEPERSVIVWRFEQDLSYEEIGDKLGITPEAARKRCVRTLKELRVALERHQ